MLTIQLNGSSPSNIVKASWWNDYHDLLTGVMNDQPVTLACNASMKLVYSAADAGSAAMVLNGGGSMGVGTYKFVYTYVMADGGETLPSPVLSITTTSGNQSCTINNLPTGPTGTVKRNIYQSKLNTTSPLYFAGSVNDNTTNWFYTNNADSALGTVIAPTHSTFGGSIFNVDASGNVLVTKANDGTVIGNSSLQSYGSPVAPTGSVASGGSMGVGVYKYVATWLSSDGGESLQSSQLSVTTTSSNKTVNLTVPTGPVGTFKRNLYRTTVGGSTFDFLATISDNTTTAYTDSVADGSLGTSVHPPSHSSYGGAILLRDATGAITCTIYNDGSISTGGTTAFGNTTIGGTLSVTSNTSLSGTLSVTGSSTLDGQVIDSGGIHLGNNDIIDIKDSGGVNRRLATLLAADGDFHLYTSPANNRIKISKYDFSGDMLQMDTSGLDLLGNTLTAGNITCKGPLTLQPASGLGVIVTTNSGLGIKMANGTKLFEGKSNGTFVISGTTYYSSQSSVATAASGSFDGYDFAETYLVDQEYAPGTILCPADTSTSIAYDGSPQANQPQLTQCTHDGCNLAMSVVKVPGYCSGLPNVPSASWYDNTLPLTQACALTGRVFMKTAFVITPRSYVCSDGRGGVRAVSHESQMAVGVTLGPTVNGMVPVLVRPTFVSVP